MQATVGDWTGGTTKEKRKSPSPCSSRLHPWLHRVCWLSPLVVLQLWLLVPSVNGLAQPQPPIKTTDISTNKRIEDPNDLGFIPRQKFLKATALVVGGTLSPFWLPFRNNNDNDRAHAMTTDPKTGIALPDVGEIEAAVPTDLSDIDNPFLDGASTSKTSAFGRLDATPDSIFYAEPRFVQHVDDQAVKTMTSYISQQAIPNGIQSSGDNGNIQVLDLCSSWTSHIDLSMISSSSPLINNDNTPVQVTRISGLGMNAKELEANPVLTDWVVRDLNENPVLPYDDNTFDVVLCQLSIDYLTRPLEVMKQVGRVLRPQGTVHILFSNRLFLSKAVALWTGADDIDHTYTVACYLQFCNGNFTNIQAKDLSIRKGRDKRISGDPLYVVTATKKAQ